MLNVALLDAGAGRDSDPRVGLKDGFQDAGQAASHLALAASLPKPTGFLDPTNAGRRRLRNIDVKLQGLLAAAGRMF